MPKKSKHHALLADPDVERWYKNCRRGSHTTAEVNLRRLGLFCEQHRLTPRQLATLGREDRSKLEDLVEDHVTWMEEQGHSPGYVEGILKGVRSWLVHNEVELKRKIKISNRGATPTLQEERVPEKEEFKAILIYGDERASAAVCLVGQGGLRLQVLGNSRGDDGLTIGDLPELKIHEGHAEFTRTPTMIVVRPSLSKAAHRYITFLPTEGCKYLTAYLNKRLAEGEDLTAKTPAIANKSDHTFITTKNVSKIIRKTIRPRFSWRPYVLRAYFATQMLLAESHGRVSHPYRMFFMGHKGDIEARYTTNKGRLPKNLIEDMRMAFQNSAEYLETTSKPEKDKKEMLLEMWREQAKMYGIDPMKVRIEKKTDRPLDLDAEMKAIQLEIKKQIDSFRLQKESEEDCNGDSRYESRIVGEQELRALLDEGWQFVAPINNDKYILRKTLSGNS